MFQSGKTKFGVIIISWLAWSSLAGLQAQAPYKTASGQSTTYAFYDPLQSPAPKAPGGASLAPVTQSKMPVVPPSQYAANQAATAPYAQSSFSSPAQVQVSTVIPRAPATAPPIVPIPTVSFQGITESIPQVQPPSPEIAVGPTDVVMVVNSFIAQYTKTGSQVSLTAFQDFFGTLLPTICPTGTANCQIFDPTIRYDQLHGRFIFLASTRTIPDLRVSYNLISVTNGATYNSGWKTWLLNAGFDGNVFTGNWADSWRVGFDNLAVYLAGNLYDSQSNFQYAKIRVLMKSDLYNPATVTMPYKDVFQLTNADGSLSDSVMPVHQRGKPSAVNSQLVVNATTINVPATYLTVWKIADPTANPVVAHASTITGLLPYNFPHPAPQLGSGVTFPALLDSGDSRILKAVYRNGFLYTARDTGYTDVTGAATTVTYDVVNTTTMKLASQARLLNTNSFYPAFDVPATVPTGASYAAASGTACPWCITGTTTDASGNATYASISSLKPGKDFYDLDANSTIPNRWGDYFGGAVDPITGGLWTAGQYAETRQAQCPGNPQGCPVGIAGVWGTWVGYFPWQTVSTFTDVPAPFTDYANVMSSWGVTSGCTPTTFCPNNSITRWQFAIFLIGAMEGSPCPNNTTCTGGFTYTAKPYFTDVPATDPGFPFVQKLRDLGITSGCTATSFCPNDMVPRWEAAVMIVRGKLKALFGDTFTYPPTPLFPADVPANSAMFPFVQKLSELGITAGCTATQFCPNNPITRVQAAIFIVRGFLN